MPKRTKTASNVSSGNGGKEPTPPDDSNPAKKRRESAAKGQLEFTCKECGRTFQYAKTLARHFQDFHSETAMAGHKQAPFRRVPRRTGVSGATVWE